MHASASRAHAAGSSLRCSPTTSSSITNCATTRSSGSAGEGNGPQPEPRDRITVAVSHPNGSDQPVVLDMTPELGKDGPQSRARAWFEILSLHGTTDLLIFSDRPVDADKSQAVFACRARADAPPGSNAQARIAELVVAHSLSQRARARSAERARTHKPASHERGRS